MQGIGRRDDLRIPYPGPEALTAQDFVQKGDAAANLLAEVVFFRSSAAPFARKIVAAGDQTDDG